MGDNWWMIRSGRRGSEHVEEFLKAGQIGVGFIPVSLADKTDKAAIRAEVEKVHPDESKPKLDVRAAQLHRFRNVIAPGDTVVTFDSDARLYHLGKIAGDYFFVAGEELPHRRPVKWTGSVSRDVLNVSTRNTLGAIATIFSLEGDARHELAARAAQPQPPVPDPKLKIEIEDYFHETERKATELIADTLSRLDEEELPELVAALLRATGYYVRMGSPGADRGVDLYASPDPWMAKEPHIKVQVKHRTSAMGGPEVRNFIGTLQVGDTGIYVSTGGFTKDARYEAERSSRPLSLVDRDELIALYLSHYEKLDADVQTMLPVKRVYLPVTGTEGSEEP